MAIMNTLNSCEGCASAEDCSILTDVEELEKKHDFTLITKQCKNRK